MFTERVKEKFAEKFPASKMPDRKTVYRLLNKFDDIGSVEDYKRNKPGISEEKSFEITDWK